jgi:hypothetical protein
MALRLNVGVSRKLGLPEYSSAGASCNLELELPEGLLQTDLNEFQHRVRDAYVAAHQAVNDELARLQAQAQVGAAPGPTGRVVDRAGRDGVRDDDRPAPRPGAGRSRPSRPATPSQVKAILSIARKQRADLDGLLGELGVTRPEELSLADASRLIDQLKLVGQI